MTKLFIHTLALSICSILIYSCASSRATANYNIGNIEITINAVSGQDSLVRTANGSIIGKIDSDGNIRDITTNNKIGVRNPSHKELMEQAMY